MRGFSSDYTSRIRPCAISCTVSHSASGEIVLDATAGSDAGIDVVSSEYATIAAEQTALENLSRDVADRIVAAVALKLRGGQ